MQTNRAREGKSPRRIECFEKSRLIEIFYISNRDERLVKPS
jgi:hypothetical protein